MKFFSLLIILVLISGCKTRWSKRSGDKYDVQVGLVSKVGEEYDLNDSHRIKLYLLSKFKRRIRYDYEQGLLSKSQFEFYDRHAKDSPDDRMFKILISRIQADYKAGNLSKSY